MKKVFLFNWDCGRMGVVDGCFIAEDEEVKKAIGRQVYLGEVLGKHSEVYGRLDEEDLKVVTSDPLVIKELIKGGDNICGYNPLDYIDEAEEEDE